MREDNNFYLPILKSKAGELKALSKLDRFTRAHVFPLFEVTPMEWDHTYKTKPKEIEEHLNKFSKKIADNWDLTPCLIDTHLIADRLCGQLSCIEYVFSNLIGQSLFPVQAMPTFQANSPESLLNGIKNIATSYQINQAGLRINLDALTDPSFQGIVDLALAKTGFTPDHVHLILDLQNSNLSQTEDYSDAIVAAMEDFPYLKIWRTFTICSGAFPSSGNIKKNQSIIPRYDWTLFEAIQHKLRQETFERKVNYGDYSIVNPEYFEFDPTKMSASANIRYTLNNDWLVVKGNSIKKSGNAQYLAQAMEIAASEHFLGKDYSQGDLYIDQCANGKESPGNPTTWNWVANNHHFTKVVADLFSSPLSA